VGLGKVFVEFAQGDGLAKEGVLIRLVLEEGVPSQGSVVFVEELSHNCEGLGILLFSSIGCQI
jgi:hypothetical protein